MSIEASSSSTSVAAKPASPSSVENGIVIYEDQTCDELKRKLKKLGHLNRCVLVSYGFKQVGHPFYPIFVP
jgi:hypothetical protein